MKEQRGLIWGGRVGMGDRIRADDFCIALILGLLSL